jgi:hypothetical protein
MGGGKGPKAMGGSPMSLWIYVKDCDALFKRAVEAGAKVQDGPMGAMQDQFWGDRSGTFTDPSGYRWTIATRKEDLTPQEMKQRQDEWMKQFAGAHSPTPTPRGLRAGHPHLMPRRRFWSLEVVPSPHPSPGGRGGKRGTAIPSSPWTVFCQRGDSRSDGRPRP